MSISRPYKIYFAGAGLGDILGAVTGGCAGKACKSNKDCGSGCACNSITKKCTNITTEANRGYFGPTASVERRADDAMREIQKTRGIVQKEAADIKSIANKLLGESNQWQGTVNDIMEKIQGNVPMIVVGGAALLVLLFIARR